MDWITGFPPCGPLGYNAIYTVVKRTTRAIRLSPCVLGAGEMSAEATAKLFFDGIVGHYRLPDEVLLRHRIQRGGTRYLVRWTGYGPEHDEWLHEEELGHARSILD